MIQEMIKEKLSLSLFSTLSAILLGEIGFFTMFPSDIFKSEAFVYPIFTQGFISLFEYYTTIINFKPEVSGIKPLKMFDIIKLLVKLLMACFSSFLLVAGLLSYAKLSPGGLLVDTILLLNKKEGLILFGLLVGLFFEFVSGDQNRSFLKNQIKDVWFNFIKKQSEKLK